jgi:hypothetical protein
MKPKFSLRDLFWIVFVAATPFALHAEEDGDKYVRPYPIISYSKADEIELKPLAREVARFNGNSWVQAADVNPICCVWLEFIGTPNPGEPGYIILHQGGGTVIRASNIEQMQAALKRWQASSKRIDGAVTFPEGLSTNYKVVK